MPTISADKQLQQYWPLLGNEEKKSILGIIKSFLKLKEESVPAHQISIEEYNKEAYEAIERVKSGQYHTHEEVEEMAKEW